MSWLTPFVQYVSQPVVSATNILAAAVAAVEHRPVGGAESTAAAFAISTGLIGLFCICWACWMHARLGNFRIAARIHQASSDAAKLFGDALLNHGMQSVIVLRSGEKPPQDFGDANTLLHDCRAGQDGQVLADALEALLEKGTSFKLSARTPDNQLLAIHGLPVGGRAVLYLQEKAKSAQDFREVLDALPMPIWLHEKDMPPVWANSAFLRTIDVESIKDAPARALEWAAPDLPATALTDRRPVEIRRHAVVAGERRTFAVSLLPLHGATVAGVALDITASAKLEARLCLELDAQTDMMEQFPMAVAVFDAERRLVRYNGAYAGLWGFSEAWLDSHPSQDEILDRLRDARKLPEQRSFSEWKLGQSQLFDKLAGPSEKLWHLPGGKSLRVMVQPHLLGGIFILFEDISEELRLQAAVTLLTQIQRATLDTIDDGMAIFGTDGRLLLHNSQFAKLWRLTEEELSRRPHLSEIANLTTARVGRDGIWSAVAWGVNSASPENLSEWSKTRRADGKLIALALSRLPNGATVVTFSDLTDLERFTAEQNAAKQITHEGKVNFAT